MQWAFPDLSKIIIHCWKLEPIHMYEGRPINKLQNGIILLIFKMWKKIQNIGFVGNLIGHIYFNFYKDTAIIMSHVHRTQSV